MLDELLKADDAPLDRGDRLQLYDQIEQVMYTDAVYIPLWKDPDLFAVSRRLQNVKWAGASPFWNVAEWAINP